MGPLGGEERFGETYVEFIDFKMPRVCHHKSILSA